MVLLLGLFGLLAQARAGDVVVSMLDVGQGDSLLIQTPTQKNILIDAGDGKIKVAPLLTAHGVDHLDLVIASHPHADHIGGMLAVLQAFPVKNFDDNGLPHTTQTYLAVESELKARQALPAGDPQHIEAVGAIRGDTFDIGDGATLTVLFPDGNPVRGSRSDLNSNSVVVRLNHGDDCFLFMGDAEEPTERRLLDAGLGQCDVLKVAHHGSEYATTPAFLAAVAPKVALISVGAHNNYGHPGPNTVARLQSEGAAVYRTDLNGEITVRSTGHGEKVTTARVDDAVAAGAGAGAIADAGVPLAPVGLNGARVAPVKAASPTVPTSAAPTAAAPTTGAPTTAAPTSAAPTTGAHTTTAAALTPSAAKTTASAAAETMAAPASGAATTDAATCPFPASAKSEVFHEDGCGNAAKISAENLVCYPTREAAIAAGKRPAGCCKP